MSLSRDAILNRLKRKQNKATTSLTKVIIPPPKANKNTDLKSLLISKLEENKIEVHAKKNLPQLTDTLVEIAKRKNIKSWLLGQKYAYQDTFITALKKNATVGTEVNITRFDEPYENLKKSLFHHIEASITMAKWAIAETGTLVLIPDKNEPRMMSLAPPIHFILLDEKDITPNFQDLVDKPEWATKEDHAMPSNILFISSPSKTADIQQTIAYGAHGPKEVIVLINQHT